MRDWRTLITTDIGNTRLQQSLGNRQYPFAVKGFASAHAQHFHLFAE
jgi:hypothetical protein